METNQFEEIAKQFEILKSENIALKKDIKVIKSIVSVLAVMFVLLWLSYGIGYLAGLIQRFLN